MDDGLAKGTERCVHFDGFARCSIQVVPLAPGGRNVSALARELGIRRKFLYEWQEAFRSKGEAGLKSRPETAKAKPEVGVRRARDQAVQPPNVDLKQRVAELERQLGVKQMEVDFFKLTFEHVRGALQTPNAAGAGESTEASKPGSRSKDRD